MAWSEAPDLYDLHMASKRAQDIVGGDRVIHSGAEYLVHGSTFTGVSTWQLQLVGDDGSRVVVDVHAHEDIEVV